MTNAASAMPGRRVRLVCFIWQDALDDGTVYLQHKYLPPPSNATRLVLLPKDAGDIAAFVNHCPVNGPIPLTARGSVRVRRAAGRPRRWHRCVPS